MIQVLTILTFEPWVTHISADIFVMTFIEFYSVAGKICILDKIEIVEFNLWHFFIKKVRTCKDIST